MRGRYVMAVMVLGLVLLSLRTLESMLLLGGQYRTQADNNRFFTRAVYPPRGIILDRNRIPLVENSLSFGRFIQDPFSIAPHTAPIDERQALDLLVHQPELLARFPQRFYPFGTSLSHAIGYVGFSSSLNAPYNQKVGMSGLERTLQSDLVGSTGSEEYEINATGKLTRLVHTTAPQHGSDITVSLDSALSQKAAALLQDRIGAVIVSDIESSQVLALVSSPGFNPMDLSAALTDPKKPLLNRALQVYPPGSVFKMIVSLAALKQGTIKGDTLITDEGELKVGDATFRNWYFSSYGRTEGDINVVRALTRSNDVFFYKVAAQTGPDGIAEMARIFHFGAPTGIELSGEEGGLVPTPQWKEKAVGEKWYLGDTYHMGIGQGDVLVSPLQINAMTAALARGGIWCRPTLMMGKAECEDLGLSKQDLQTVVEGMVGACSSGGTAFPFFQYNTAATETDKVACKTGTAEHGAKDEQGHRATHAWFTMFYPVTRSQVSITVLLESDTGAQFLEGSSDAAPIAKSIWEAWKSTRRIKPVN